MLNDDGMPKLRVSSFYKRAIQRGQGVSGNGQGLYPGQNALGRLADPKHPPAAENHLPGDGKHSEVPADFFEKGIAHLKPMVLRDVAQDIGMHESTISRVTTNKYAYTPQGIFELKYFFNSSISRIHGDAIASASVQEKIRQIIDSEHPTKPYSDDKIHEILKGGNIDIARRTVAKYREMMGVCHPTNANKSKEADAYANIRNIQES